VCSPEASASFRAGPPALAWGRLQAAVCISTALCSFSRGCREFLLGHLEHLFALLCPPWCSLCVFFPHFSLSGRVLPLLTYTFHHSSGMGRALQWGHWSQLKPAVSGTGQPWLLLTEAALQPPANTWAADINFFSMYSLIIFIAGTT